MSWFLIFFKMFSESFVIKYKIYDCYTFFCLKYKSKFCNSYTAEFHMLEILRQILWLLHQRFICLNVWKLYYAIFDFKVKFLNKKLWYKFLAICDYIHGLKINNTMFQNVKRVFHQNKAHTKISSGLQFCRSISYNQCI